MKWRYKRLITIIAVFVLCWLLVCALVALARGLSAESFSPGDFLRDWSSNALFFLGYGALDGSPAVQSVIALIAIIAISVMTTYFTISLLWRVDDVVLMPAMFVREAGKRREDPEGGFAVEFAIANQGKKIANLRLSFSAYQHRDKGLVRISSSREYTYPILFEKSAWRIIDTLKIGFFQDVLYRQFTGAGDADPKRPDEGKVILYMTLWFVDVQSGQECCNMLQYSVDNLYMGPYEEKFNRYSFNRMKKEVRAIRAALGEEGASRPAGLPEGQAKHAREMEEAFREFVSKPLKSFDFTRLRTVPFEGDLVFLIRPEDRKYRAGVGINTAGSRERFPMFFFDYKSAPMDWTIYEDDHVHLAGSFVVEGSIQELMLEVKSGNGFDQVRAFYSKILAVSAEGRVKFDICLKEIYDRSNGPDFSRICEINVVFVRVEENGAFQDLTGRVWIEHFGLLYHGRDGACGYPDRRRELLLNAADGG